MTSISSLNSRTYRITVTLDAGVNDYVVQRLAEDNNLTHKTLINDLLRQGIRVDSEPRLAPFEIKRFKTKLAKRHHDG
jgi:hypothetical protein